LFTNNPRGGENHGEKGDRKARVIKRFLIWRVKTPSPKQDTTLSRGGKKKVAGNWRGGCGTSRGDQTGEEGNSYTTLVKKILEEGEYEFRACVRLHHPKTPHQPNTHKTHTKKKKTKKNKTTTKTIPG